MFKIFNLEGLFLSKAKKIISMLLAIAMVLTVAPVSVLASAAPAYTYGSVSFSKTDFSVDTSATTEVLRIAQTAGSFSIPAQGAAGTIVSATPSGIPENSGTYNMVAYAKETPVAPKVVFTINGNVELDEAPAVSASASGVTVAKTPEITTSGSSKTYSYAITGSAIAGTDVVFTITYKIKGTSYTAYAFSHVEHILVMSGFAAYVLDTNGTSSDSRMSVAVQIQSKNMYTDRVWKETYWSTMHQGNGDPTKTLGYINYASTSALYDADGSARNALLGLGSESNVDGSSNAYGSAVPNNNIDGYEVGAFIKYTSNQNQERYNGCFANDGNRPEPIVYYDKKDSFNSLNTRITTQPAEAADAKTVQMHGVYTYSYVFTYAEETGGFTQDSALNGVWAAANRTSGSNGSDSMTISGSAGNRNFNEYMMAPIQGTGPTQDSTWSVVVDHLGTGNGNTWTAGGITVVYKVYDSTTLDNLFYGVLQGKARDGSASYGSYTFNKAPNPQKSMYSEASWSAFETALKAAGSVLAKPDTNQTEVDTATNNLWTAYQGLTGYNATVNWEVKHYLEGTTTPIIDTQTVDPNGVYGQGQPAGSTWIANAATIEGYTVSGSSSKNMTITGKNATETLEFFYTPLTKNFIVNTNATGDPDVDVTTTPTKVGTVIYEDTLATGTKPYYTFDGWYYDDGVWSQPVFSDSLADEGGRYIVMPANQTTIFAKWVTTPITIQYQPIAEGNKLPMVTNLGHQAGFDENGIATFNRPANLNVDGYLFVEYYADEALTTLVQWPLTFTLGVTETPYTIYARMVDVNGKISFESNGGTPVEDISFTTGTTVNPPPAPTKQGYDFAGWYDETLTTQYNFPITMTNMTGFIAYAKWTPQIHWINYDLGTPTTEFDTASLPSISGYSDSPIESENLPPTPKKFGYIFKNWEHEGKYYEFIKYPTTDITLTPVWEESDTSAFIKLDAYEKLSGNVGEPITTAQVGDIVTFRMTPQTNFYNGSSVFVFMYDSNFYEIPQSDSDAFSLNPESEYVSGLDASHIGVTNDSVLPWPSELANDHNGGYKAMMVAIDPQVTASNYKTVPMGDGKWVVEFRLRVKDTATGSGTVYMDNAWTRTPDNIMGTMFFGWSSGPVDVYNTYNNMVTPDLYMATATVSLDTTAPAADTSVTLDPNGGKFVDKATGTETTTAVTFTGRAETEILDYVAPVRDGYDLAGWANADASSTATWAEGYYPTVDLSGETYAAQWTAKMYTVKFYKDMDATTEYFVADYAYNSEITGPATPPTKQGYVFDGWADANGNKVTIPGQLCPIDGASYYATYAPATDTPYIIRVSYTNNQNGVVVNRDTTYTGTTGNTVAIVETAGTDPNTHYVLTSALPTVTGYEFDAANNTLPITGVIAADGSLILNVTYKASIVTVTLDANGGAFANGDTTYALNGEFQSIIEESALPAAPTRVGYTFAGWQGLTAGTTRYTPNRTFKANWNVVTYKVTFDSDEGLFADGSTTKISDVAFGASIVPSEGPTKEGWTFLGWATTKDATAAETLGTLDTEGDRTYYAVYEQTKYSVTYYVDDVADSERSLTDKHMGDSITIASAPEKYGYVFSGWTMNDAAATDFVMPANNVDIFGYFTPGTYDVTFDANGGFFDGDTSVTTKTQATEFDSLIAPPAVSPARTGYEFLGWAASKADADAKATITSWPALTTTDAVTYYAVWNATNANYTVEFYYQNVDATDYVVNADETLTYNGLVDTQVSYNAENNKTGFTLNTSKSVLTGTVSAETPLVLKVYFDRNQYTLYTVIDGTTSEAGKYYYGADVTTPSAPAKEGYTFVDWSPAVVTPMPAADQTVTAVYEADDFTVTFYMDDTKAETVYTRTGNYQSDYNVPTATKTGYTFVAWIDAATGAEAGLTSGSVTQIPLNGGEYYATWTKNSYDVIYRAQGGAFTSGQTVTIKVPYGTAKAEWATPDENPTRTGYTFVKWNLDAVTHATMPAETVNVLPVWAEETYTVIWNIDGNTDNQAQYKYGEAIEVPGEDVTVKEGYTFIGWDTEPMATMEDIGDDGATVTYTAQFEINEYTITFDVDGGTPVADITLNYGEAITANTTTTKTGYTFLGWYEGNTKVDVPANMPAKDMNLKAKWEINKYTITFNVDGGTEVAAISQDYGTAITADTTTTKTGYTFAGWVDEEGNAATVPATMPDKSMTLKATWDINEYTITFDVDGGTPVAPITQDYDSDITADTTTTKTGYTFAGWVDAEGKEATVPAKMPANDMTLKATWTIKQYTITFNTDGGTPVAPITQDYDTAVTAPENPTKTGYVFGGWDTPVPEKMPANDLTLNAIWNIDQFSITFNTDGGTPVAPITQDYNTAITADTTTTKLGYTFAGWVNEEGEKVEVPSTMPAENMVLKATWDINQYTITFIVDGGTDVAPITQDYNTDITADTTTTKVGHTFAGWINADGEATTVPAKMPAESITLTATWTVNTYTVTFVDNDGAVFHSEELAYEAVISAPADSPVLTYYEFVGWSFTEVELGTKAAPVDKTQLISFTDAAPTVPANDITIYPAFDRVAVTLTVKATSTAVIEKDRAEDPITGYIYGIRTKLTKTKLVDEYLEVVGDGRIEVTPTKYNRCGTGTEVNVYDNVDNQIVETYYVIVFGDVNGDSAVDAADVAAIDAEVAGATHWSLDFMEDEYDYCKVLAADIAGMNDADSDGIDDDGHNGDGVVNANDAGLINSAVLLFGTIDQTNGAYIANNAG